MEEYKVIVDGGKDLHFNGSIVAEIESAEELGEWGKPPNERTVLKIFKTEEKRFICEKVIYRAGELNQSDGLVASHDKEVESFFGSCDLAKQLYVLAKIPHAIWVN